MAFRRDCLEVDVAKDGALLNPAVLPFQAMQAAEEDRGVRGLRPRRCDA